MSEIDWASLQKEAATAGLLPDGDYNVIVVDSSATTASTGKPMIKVKLRVLDGPHKDKPVWNQFVISPESAIALRIFFQHMAAFGLGSDFFAANPHPDVVAKTLINRGAAITLGHRAWQGQDRNDVQSIRPLPAGGPTPPGLVTTAPSVGPSGMTPSAPAGPPVPTTTAAPVPTVPNVGPIPPGAAPPAQPF